MPRGERLRRNEQGFVDDECPEYKKRLAKLADNAWRLERAAVMLTAYLPTRQQATAEEK